MKCALIIMSMVSFICSQARDTVVTQTPQKAAMYGALFPGAGQLYNQKWLKSLVLVTLEGTTVYFWNKNKDIYNDYEAGSYSLPKHRYLEKRNKYAWWIFFIYVYGILDAVVDSHLQTFSKVMDENIETTENIGEK